MRTTRTRLAPLAAAGALALPVMMAMPAAADEQELMAELGTLNDSGVTGTAWASIDGTTAHVKVDYTGALDGNPHAQHIHIGGQGVCPDPNMEGTGPNGEIRTTDALDSYGEVRVSLTNEPGKTDESAALDVANFPATGTTSYERTFEVPQDIADSLHNGDGVVVVHGVDHNGSGAYDGDQESDLDPSLPSEATDPAACGAFEAMDVNSPGGPIETGGDSSSGMEYSGLLGLGAVTIGAGALGLAVARRRDGAAQR